MGREKRTMREGRVKRNQVIVAEKEITLKHVKQASQKVEKSSKTADLSKRGGLKKKISPRVGEEGEKR